ncbi:MAG: nucleotidyltransferase family protein [Acidobacteriia bacterium]|nr:nucleotidyltransferase family protein [Terriglobia bacterium]
MKAFILAAGNGTRLRPLTDKVPKCLLPIQGVPLLEIWLRHCEAAGVREALVNSHAHAQQVKEFVAGRAGVVQVSVAEEPELLGSAGTLADNRGLVAGEGAFFVFYGDVLTNASLSALWEFHREKRLPVTLGITQVADPSRCGIVSADESGIVRGFVEKPSHPESNWAFGGVMVASQEIFDAIPGRRPADIGFDVLPRLVGRMAAYRISSYLMDVGTLENYRAAQESWPGL